MTPDLDRLRELIAKDIPWPDLDGLPSDGPGYYECPLCGGEGAIGAELVHTRRSSAWAGGVQFYGIGDEHLLIEEFYRLAHNALPALLDRLTAAEAEVGRLRGAIRAAAKDLAYATGPLQAARPAHHSGDPDEGHDEDCRLCSWQEVDSIIEIATTRLAAALSDAPEGGV